MCAVKQMFAAMSYCQGLHPDPMDAQVEEEDEELEDVLEEQNGDGDYEYEYDYEEDNSKFIRWSVSGRRHKCEVSSWQ